VVRAARCALVVVPERGQGVLQLGHVRPGLARRQVSPGGYRAGQREHRLAVDLGQLRAVGDGAARGDVQLRDVHRGPAATRGRGRGRGRTPAEPAGGVLAYTSYCVAGYTSPRIWTDAVMIWDTTAAVVTVAGGAAMPTPSSTRRRRTSRDPHLTSRPLLPSGPLAVAVEPSCVTRSSVTSHAARQPGGYRRQPLR
jgi:hypothetical protein